MPIDPKTYEERAIEALRQTYDKREPLSDWGLNRVVIVIGLLVSLCIIIDLIVQVWKGI